MLAGLRRTADVLARTRNAAVLPVLASALGSTSADVRAMAIRATVRRLDLESHTELIRRFAEFTPGDNRVLSETLHAMPHHLARALDRALTDLHSDLCVHACGLIQACRQYEAVPSMLEAIEMPRHRSKPVLVETLRQLAEMLHDEVLAWAGGDRSGRDPSFTRHHFLASLERTLNRHVATPAVLEAFLLLAPTDNRALLNMLQHEQHPCHERLVKAMASNPAPAAMERLVALLRDTTAPLAALRVIGRRSDLPFVDYLLHEIQRPAPLRVLHNMQRLDSVVWLEDQRDVLLEVDGRAQAVAVELAMASGIEREAQLRLLELLLQQGVGEGRRASCAALAAFRQPGADVLILSAAGDSDAGVQAAALRQLRTRKIPDALKLLIAALDSPRMEVRDAARSSLAEFNFVRYRAMFDLLDERAVRQTGALVRQVDPTAQEKLVEELSGPSVTGKVRGIEMAVAMGAMDDVREMLIALARHENVAVRKEAVAALSVAHGPSVVKVLEQAAQDANRSVADAARKGLARLSVGGTAYGQRTTTEDQQA